MPRTIVTINMPNTRMNISVNITPNIPNPKLNPNPMLSAFLLDMRFNVIPNLLPIKLGYQLAGVPFAGDI